MVWKVQDGALKFTNMSHNLQTPAIARTRKGALASVPAFLQKGLERANGRLNCVICVNTAKILYQKRLQEQGKTAIQESSL